MATCLCSSLVKIGISRTLAWTDAVFFSESIGIIKICKGDFREGEGQVCVGKEIKQRCSYQTGATA